jgi:type I restriction enzyme S subunit
METRRYSFKELLSSIIDNRGKTCPTADDGVPLIATNCIKNDALYAVYEKIRYVSEDTYKNWFRGHPRHEDLVFVCKGSPGRVAWVQDPVPYCIAQDMVAIRADRDKITPKYLFALLRAPQTQKLIENMHVGTLIPHFKKGDFQNLYFDIPTDMEFQKYVGELHFQLNEKVELNRQVNQTLEKMAQALFKSWFVDFDPVVDNALAVGNPIPDELAHRVEVRKKAHVLSDFQSLPENIRNLFPNEFEQTGEPTVGIEGWVPKGWSAMSLGDVTKELRRGISPKYTDEGGIQVINQKCIRNHEVNYALSRRNDTTLRKVDGREIEVGDVLVNSTGVGTLGRLAQVNAVPEPTVVDSHVTVVRPNPQICPIYFFGQLMVSKERSIESLGEGSTGQTELSRRILAEQLVLVPPYEQAMLIEEQLKSLSEKSSQNLKQNSALAKLRDALLPKLISGEINIKDTKECNG